jgi:arabinofuranosyltransferase
MKGTRAASGGAHRPAAGPAAKSAAETAARPGDRWFHPFAPYLLPAAIALAARLDAARNIRFAAEDAYITFRFAENWASGLGPVYNPGERVLGFTSPLWTAWIALASTLGLSSFTWSRAWGVILSLGALVLFARLIDRTVSRTSAWAFALFYALFPLFSSQAVLGMETSLLLFLLAAAANAIETRSPLAGPALGLLALTRPEGLVLAVALAVVADRRARLVGGAVLATGVALLWTYYGNPIPQTVLAKASTYGVGSRPLALYWIEGFVPAFLRPRWQELNEAQHLFPMAVVALPAAILGVAALARRRPPSPLFLAVAGGLFVLAGYVALGVPYFGWYYVLPVAAYGIAVAVGLPRVVRSRLVYAGMVLFLVTDAGYLGTLYYGRNQTEARLFGSAAEKLARASAGRGTVFLEPIGHIGYATRLRVLDEVGLVAPEVARRRRQGAGWYGDVIRERRPDYLVVRPALLDQNRSLAGIAAPFRSFAERDQVLSAYAVLGDPPATADELVVLVRRESAP